MRSFMNICINYRFKKTYLFGRCLWKQAFLLGASHVEIGSAHPCITANANSSSSKTRVFTEATLLQWNNRKEHRIQIFLEDSILLQSIHKVQVVNQYYINTNNSRQAKSVHEKKNTNSLCDSNKPKFQT